MSTSNIQASWCFSTFPLCLSVSLTFTQIQKGAAQARSDDTKSLKSAVLDWITPRGQPLNPPLSRNVKVDRGFQHECTGSLLCPAGLDWSCPEYVVQSELVITLILLTIEYKRNFVVVKWWYLETSGPSFYIVATLMTSKIRGMASSEAPSLFRCASTDFCFPMLTVTIGIQAYLYIA
jgi:Family of unknown function (DUF6698)